MVFLKNAEEQRLNIVCIFPVDLTLCGTQDAHFILHSAFVTSTFRVLRAESCYYHISGVSLILMVWILYMSNATK